MFQVEHIDAFYVDNYMLIGKKTILFPLVLEDLPYFIKLHREDEHGYLQQFCLKEMNEEQATKYVLNLLTTNQILVYTVMTKEGKASRSGGFVYISDFDEHGAYISGIMDPELKRGLAKYIRKNKYTFSQDALHTLIDHIFNTTSIVRINTNILDKNRLAISLIKRENFTKEGVLRKYVYINGKFENVAIFSLLKEEWSNGKSKTTENRDTGIQSASGVIVPDSMGQGVLSR